MRKIKINKLEKPHRVIPEITTQPVEIVVAKVEKKRSKLYNFFRKLFKKLFSRWQY